MLPKDHRLRKMKDWDILFKEGSFVGDKFVTAKVWQIDPAKYPRREYSKKDLLIGFAVGLKVSKSAVKRNRIKRQMREVVRLLLKDRKIKKGFMIGIVGKKEMVGVEYDEIERNIVGVLKKARVLK
jgi:ribonuclease P protein component